MRRDERGRRRRATTNRTPTVVAVGGARGRRCVPGDLLDALDDAGWAATGSTTIPNPRLRTVEWIAIHTMHELLHHRVDIGTV